MDYDKTRFRMRTREAAANVPGGVRVEPLDLYPCSRLMHYLRATGYITIRDRLTTDWDTTIRLRSFNNRYK